MENTTINQPKKKKSPIFGIILGILIIAGAIYGFKKWSYSNSHEETDDAQIASNVSPVISKISGYVAEVKVKDNQFVKKGDTLIILENKDQLILLQQAEAALGTAKSNLNTAKAGAAAANKSINTSNAAVGTANAQIEAAKVNVWKTTQDLKRYENLVKDHSITQQQYEQVLAAKQAADKQLQVLVEQKNQASQQTGYVSSQSEATSEQIGVAGAIIKQREVDVQNARLNLSYTIITAKQDGYVSKVPVQVGQFLQAGAQLFSIILNNEKWVVANFKETQLNKMVEGQKVEIKIDAFPDEKLIGTVSSIAPATGSTFSILPPDNASGNFVKVVQRVPVKITFNNLKPEIANKLRAGMNVLVDVEVK
ncbi:secretion protein HlyD [Cloacibacterium rupense]|uniref:Secretion protein HlyD n=1 Tax=Cloacibacterium rupense TaxID=517423 RepID=A0ABQ2NNV7_9FLAO|nr:HlyD family secretion protein [Cloacibacterium rupense]GGP06052.1 secretion protein HlyD [Cloacibacterium rupense]